ncbi:MAG: siphovirus Gp157 family protein [Sulfuricaulis sp.]|nr:siphovirus Gp157 family protein [Sulfuricaulis sp.]
MLKLYECTGMVAEALDTGFDPETGEMSPELANALTVFEGKGQAVTAYILNVEAEAEAVKAAITRLTARKRSLESRSDGLRRYLRENMATAGIKRIDAIDGTFSARLEVGRDESVEIDDGVVLPDALCRVRVEPDKAKVKNAIKAGEPVPEGVRIVRKDRLVIG